MTERSARLEQGFAALDAGPFEARFAPDGKWLGVPGSGFEGATPI